MSPPKRPLREIDVRAILESPVGRAAGGGLPICAYEAAIRQMVEKAGKGDIGAATRFFRAMESYGLLEIPEVVDDHQYKLVIPKEWAVDAWNAMYNHYGPPPWPGKHDGLVPVERWKEHYGPRPRTRRPARQR